MKGSSSRYIWSADPDIIVWADIMCFGAHIINWADSWMIIWLLHSQNTTVRASERVQWTTTVGDLYKIVWAAKWSHLGSPGWIVFSGVWATCADAERLYPKWHYWSFWATVYSGSLGYCVLCGFGLLHRLVENCIHSGFWTPDGSFSVLWGFGLVQNDWT